MYLPCLKFKEAHQNRGIQVVTLTWLHLHSSKLDYAIVRKLLFIVQWTFKLNHRIWLDSERVFSMNMCDKRVFAWLHDSANSCWYNSSLRVLLVANHNIYNRYRCSTSSIAIIITCNYDRIMRESCAIPVKVIYASLVFFFQFWFSLDLIEFNGITQLQ